MVLRLKLCYRFSFLFSFTFEASSIYARALYQTPMCIYRDLWIYCTINGSRGQIYSAARRGMQASNYHKVTNVRRLISRFRVCHGYQKCVTNLKHRLMSHSFDRATYYTMVTGNYGNLESYIRGPTLYKAVYSLGRHQV